MHLHRNRKGLFSLIVFLSFSIILLVLLFPRTAAINLPPKSLLFFTYVTIPRGTRSNSCRSIYTPAGGRHLARIFIRPPEPSERISRDLLVIICIFRVADECERNRAAVSRAPSAVPFSLHPANPISLSSSSFSLLLPFCRPTPLSKSF